MSQATAVPSTARQAPRHQNARPAPGPRLRAVAAPPHTRSRAGLAMACLTMLAAGLIGLLLLNVSLERGAYTLRDQNAQATALQEQRQALLEQLEALQAPQSLAARATALGMVPARNAAFLRASDGRVLGVPAPGVAAPTSKPVAAASISTATATNAATATGAASARPTGKASAGPSPTGGTSTRPTTGSTRRPRPSPTH